MSNRKAIAKTPDAGQLEIESVKLFGKHVSREKGRALLAATMLACALPMLLGIRLWDQIPEIVPSGLIGVDGQDALVGIGLRQQPNKGGGDGGLAHTALTGDGDDLGVSVQGESHVLSG